MESKWLVANNEQSSKWRKQTEENLEAILNRGNNKSFKVQRYSNRLYFMLGNVTEMMYKRIHV